MALIGVYLVDKSVLARMPHPIVATVLDPLFLENRVATCGMIDLEVLYSARNGDEARRVRRERRALVQAPIQAGDFERAMDVLELLAVRDRHRSARIPDLLLAAVAERTGLTVLHYDQDFDRIAEVTGQTMEWVVPRGTL